MIPMDIYKENQLLILTIIKPEDWSLEFWCRGWDADALSGYIEGYLGIPLVAVKN